MFANKGIFPVNNSFPFNVLQVVNGLGDILSGRQVADCEQVERLVVPCNVLMLARSERKQKYGKICKCFCIIDQTMLLQLQPCETSDTLI